MKAVRIALEIMGGLSIVVLVANHMHPKVIVALLETPQARVQVMVCVVFAVVIYHEYMMSKIHSLRMQLGFHKKELEKLHKDQRDQEHLIRSLEHRIDMLPTKRE